MLIKEREADMWSYMSDHLVILLVFSLMFLERLAHAYVINAVVEKPRVITCWTCSDRMSNSECKKWAPEKNCPDNYTVCQTIHRIDVKMGVSILVHKRCALPSECTLDVIGCHDTHIPGVQDCISCCGHTFCNEMVPSNLTTALLYSSLTNNQAATLPRSSLATWSLSVLQISLLNFTWLPSLTSGTWHM